MTNWEQNEIFRRIEAINNNIEKLLVKTEQENRLMARVVELMELNADKLVSHVIGNAIEKLEKPEIADAINGVSAVQEKDRVAEQRKKMDQLREKFASYREKGGDLTWNEWRKKYKV